MSALDTFKVIVDDVPEGAPLNVRQDKAAPISTQNSSTITHTTAITFICGKRWVAPSRRQKPRKLVDIAREMKGLFPHSKH